MTLIEAIDRRSVSEADARAIADLLVGVWPKPGRTVELMMPDIINFWRSYDGPEDEHPRWFVIRDDGGQRVIAMASTFPRTIGTTAGDTTVMCLARVASDPAVRGQRLGQKIVRAAFEQVDHGPFRFALFQTTPGVRPFYEKLGAVKVDNRFVNSMAEDPAANPFWDSEIMRYPGARGWPSGEIDLRGPGW